MLCGHKGYSPVIEAKEFCDDPENKLIFLELSRTLTMLKLDQFGRCEYCAKIMDKHFDP